MNPLALRHQKNYQIWHHRNLIIDKLGSPDGEAEFLALMFERDSKNYHVWSYRQWLVKRFNLWNVDGSELKYIEELLRKDVRNNSAWNHRFFVVFGWLAQSGEEGEKAISKQVLEREINFSKAAIYTAPQNPSPWNYLRGVLKKTESPLKTLETFATEFAPLDSPDEIKSSHALDLLAAIYEEDPGNEKSVAKAKVALTLLAEKYDPIRKTYWEWRRSQIAEREVGAAPV
jgi:protein farnesyltransferase/geranylgeranyltransferase type-1 subunit alpha